VLWGGAGLWGGLIGVRLCYTHKPPGTALALTKARPVQVLCMGNHLLLRRVLVLTSLWFRGCVWDCGCGIENGISSWVKWTSYSYSYS
jgi:hypothetical protein